MVSCDLYSCAAYDAYTKNNNKGFAIKIETRSSNSNRRFLRSSNKANGGNRSHYFLLNREKKTQNCLENIRSKIKISIFLFFYLHFVMYGISLSKLRFTIPFQGLFVPAFVVFLFCYALRTFYRSHGGHVLWWIMCCAVRTFCVPKKSDLCQAKIFYDSFIHFALFGFNYFS